MRRGTFAACVVVWAATAMTLLVAAPALAQEWICPKDPAHSALLKPRPMDKFCMKCGVRLVKKGARPGKAPAGAGVKRPTSGLRVAAGRQGPAPACTAGMLGVPAGRFWMGCNEKVDRECYDDEKPGRLVAIDRAYCIDRSEVTVEAYGRCVQAGGCKEPDKGGSCNWGKDDRAQHPVNCVSWEDARTYCMWVKKRLPSEAEWEKAARGTDGRKYPWGNGVPTCKLAVFDDQSGGKENNGCGERRTWPVCSKPAGNSPYGACDMAGNVWEGVEDLYEPVGSARVLRGGSWFINAGYLRASYRFGYDPTYRYDFYGFRCASHP